MEKGTYLYNDLIGKEGIEQFSVLSVFSHNINICGFIKEKIA